MIKNINFRTPFCFANFSAPFNRTKMVLYSKWPYGSQFSGEKNDLKIRSLVAEILSKNPVSFFLGHPVYQTKLDIYLTNTGCPKKNETGILLHISATKYRIFKSFFSPENWDPYANFAYKTVSVRFYGTEIFAR